MNTKKSFLLMTPGPVLVPEEIMESFSEPIIHHRTDEFEADLKYVLEKLPYVFQTQEKVYLHTSTGSGAMESAIVNTLSSGDTVLSIVCGKFGERWSNISKAYGLKVIEYSVNWGESFSVEKVKEYFQNNPNIKAVLCQACETSTGALNPIQELSEYVRKTSSITIVDAITALGATKLKMDEWGVDVLLGGSQKAFMLPTGLSMIGFSKKAQKMMETSNLPKYYWSIKLEEKSNLKNQTYFSSPVSLIKALKTSLQIIHKMGIENFIQRHEQIALAVRLAGESLCLKVYAHSPSPTITAFLLPPNVNGEKVQELMSDKYGITIGGGQDQLKGKIIRIGHMGAIEKSHLIFTFECLAKVLTELGHPVDSKNAILKIEESLEKLPFIPKVKS